MNIIAFAEESRPLHPIGENLNASIRYIDRIAPILKNIFKKEPVICLNLWVRGSSGAILATFLTAKLYKSLDTIRIHHVKKEGEIAHSSDAFEYDRNSRADIHIILDDFARSGQTVNAIYDKMKGRGLRVDYLILGNMTRDEYWPFNFTPSTLIIDNYSATLVKKVKPDSTIRKAYKTKKTN